MEMEMDAECFGEAINFIVWKSQLVSIKHDM